MSLQFRKTTGEPGGGILNLSLRQRKTILVLLAGLCLVPVISPPVALLGGLVAANLIGQPFGSKLSKVTKMLLQVAVVGLGFGMNLHSALRAGSQGMLFTMVSIAGTLLAGWGLGRLLKTDRKTSSLISSGTAICGGSAIAAVAPIIGADEKQTSVALGTVFILNSVALLIFPLVGHSLQMSEHQFGLWSAIAIHDTSSVVGAASRYGQQALEVATTVKLARALWIIPVSLLFAALSKAGGGKIKWPWFIGWFIVAMALNTYVEPVQVISPYVASMAKAALTMTLFLIGAGLSFKMLRSVGARPLVLAVVLWVIISTVSLLVISTSV